MAFDCFILFVNRTRLYHVCYRIRIVYDERQCRNDFNAMSSMNGDINNADYAASLICFLPTDKHAKMICVVMYFPFINKSLISDDIVYRKPVPVLNELIIKLHFV